MQFFDPLVILSILIALSVHEWAHAVTAHKLGDPTPESMGRLTLNPISHLDPLGAVLFLTAGFGWAKPVPVNPLYFKDRRRGMILTALAGPLSNLVMAFVSLVILTLLLRGSSSSSIYALLNPQIQGGSIGMIFLVKFLSGFLFVNLGLMAFNVIPIPPLDGSRVLEALIPSQYLHRYLEFAQNGPYILFAILIAERFVNLNLISGLIGFIMTVVFDVMTMLIHLVI